MKMRIILFLKNIYRFFRIRIEPLIGIEYYLMRIFPIKNNKIVVSNYYGKGYGDNAKYIVKYILNKKTNLEIIWLVSKKNALTFPKEVKQVKKNSISAIYHMCTSKVWIDNCRKSSFVKKRKEQFYIQTWHGGLALKRIEKDVEHNLNKLYLKNAKYDSKIADIFISNSRRCSEMYRESFWYDGKILECGSPRCDVLFSKKNNRQELAKIFQFDEKKKIVLYAPTFRKNLSQKEYDLNFDKLILSLEEKYGGEWIVFLRLHPNIKKSNIKQNSKGVIDVTKYDDMYELLATSDVLITDYSSTMFEFSLTKKPVFLYASDIKEYSGDRGFYFNLNELPYSLAETTDELISNIAEFNLNIYEANINNFFFKVGIKETGKASKIIVEIIEKLTGIQSDNGVLNEKK